MNTTRHMSRRQLAAALLAGSAAAAPFATNAAGPSVTSLDPAGYTAIAASPSTRQTTPSGRGSGSAPRSKSIDMQQGSYAQSSGPADPSVITVEMTHQRKASQSSVTPPKKRSDSVTSSDRSDSDNATLLPRDTCPPAGRCGPGYSHSKHSYRCLSDKERAHERTVGIAVGGAFAGVIGIPVLAGAAYMGYRCAKPRRGY